MTDILERLRHECELLRPESNWRQLTEEAVAEIEKLRADVESLKEYKSQKERSASLSGYRPDEDGFGGYPMMFNYYDKR
jgi:hypothetical protein